MKNSNTRSSIDKTPRTSSKQGKNLKIVHKFNENDQTDKHSKTTNLRNKSQGQSQEKRNDKEATTRMTRSSHSISDQAASLPNHSNKQTPVVPQSNGQTSLRSVGKITETTAERKSCSRTRQQQTRTNEEVVASNTTASKKKQSLQVKVSQFESPGVANDLTTDKATTLASKQATQTMISEGLSQVDLMINFKQKDDQKNDGTRIQNQTEADSNILFTKEENGPQDPHTQTLTQKRGRGRPRKHPLPSAEEVAEIASKKESKKAGSKSKGAIRTKSRKEKKENDKTPEKLKTIMNTSKAMCNTAENERMNIMVDHFLDVSNLKKEQPTHQQMNFESNVKSRIQENSISSVINLSNNGTDRKLENLNGFSPFIKERDRIQVSNFSPSNFKSVEKDMTNPANPYVTGVNKHKSAYAPTILMSELNHQEQIVPPRTDELLKHDCDQFQVYNAPFQGGETSENQNDQDNEVSVLQYNPNNQEKSFASPMDFKQNGQSRHLKNSILGSSQMNSIKNGTTNFEVQDINMYDGELNDESKTHSDQKMHNKGGRDHLKRKAKVMRNSKYDESCFMVDYSGNRNKFTKNSELDVKILQSSSSNTEQCNIQFGNKSGQTTTGKISGNDNSSGGIKKSKRLIKQNMKQSEKQNKYLNPDSVFVQIQQIKIDKLNDMNVKTRSPSDFEQNKINASEEEMVQEKHKQIYSYGSKSNSRFQEQNENEELDTMRFASMQQQYPQELTNLNQEGELTAVTNIQKDANGFDKNDIHQFGETQLNLIKHQQLNPHLYKRGPTKYQKQQNNSGGNAKVKGHWTEHEDKILTESVRANGGKNWKKIAESLSERTDVQCLHRWQKVLNPSLVKGPWTDIEDRLLLHLVNVDAPKHWTQIANHLPGRIGKQCRERWHNHLNPMIKRAATWTTEEEWILFLLNRDLANKWADIANILEGRTDNTIKNHWNSSMKKRIKEIQDEFAMLFQNKCLQMNIKFIGMEPVETNDNGDPLYKNKVPKGYTREYIKVMKDFEQELLNYKSQEVKLQNKKYYTDKCKEYIANSENDSFFKAAANLMLTSGSEYLDELKEEYKDKMMCSDKNILNENILPVDEQQVSDIIDKVCNQNKQQISETVHEQKILGNSKKFDITPDQLKMVGAYDSSNTRARVQDTDKENIQVNKPSKRQSKSKKGAQKMVNSFQDIIQNENQVQSNKNRQPFKPIDRLTKVNNVLQEIQTHSPYYCGSKQQSSGSSGQVEYPFTWEKFKQKETIMHQQQSAQYKAGQMQGNNGAANMIIKKQNVSNESNKKIYTPFKNNSFCPSKENANALKKGSFQLQKQFSLADSLQLSDKQGSSDQQNKHKSIGQGDLQIKPSQWNMGGYQYNIAQVISHFQNQSMMNQNFHVPENIHPELNIMKPSGYVSSKKMIGSAQSNKQSINNRISSLISPNLKLIDSDNLTNNQNKDMSTPKIKEVTKFNLSGEISQKMNIKKPIPTYQNNNMVKTLFSHESGKNGSCESTKQLGQQLYSNFKGMGIKNFNAAAQKEDSRLNVNSNKNSSSLEDMFCCVNFRDLSLNLTNPQNSNLNTKNGPMNYGASSRSNAYMAEEVDMLPASSADDQVFKEHEIIPQPSKQTELVDTAKRHTE